ncbi:tetratricopeptide repeat protein [Gemmatimonas sp.]|jgi:tetratricopeptide (TPR) repeat protein|uniref:tetratricopeptide repeat protein n=1 Tax=Gemmatimonas sp. TaxID=1962908 RepID=UPI0031BCD190|nr:tetratricopeptide repeat protein [Gemmatimonas sp.]
MPTYTAAEPVARFRARASCLAMRLVTRATLAAAVCGGVPIPAAAAQTASVAATRVSEPTSYAELWQAAAVAVDQGEFERDERTRTALFVKATSYARRAVALNANDPEGYFQLARAVGRTALALGPRERVKYGVEVREHALNALRLKPQHPGALHVMGVWNAEIMRLGGFTRAVAKTFLGGQIFGSASWAEAVRYLEQAVQVEPDRLVHRLDLARIYRDMGRTAEARRAYGAAIVLADSDPNDATYRQQAGDELRRLR